MPNVDISTNQNPSYSDVDIMAVRTAGGVEYHGPTWPLFRILFALGFVRPICRNTVRQRHARTKEMLKYEHHDKESLKRGCLWKSKGAF